MEPSPGAWRDGVEGIPCEVRPEWLAGRTWWRTYVAGNPKLLLRYREHAIEVAQALAADEARFRREHGGGAAGPGRARR